MARGPKVLLLSQRNYALEVVDECGLLGAKRSTTPIEEIIDEHLQLDHLWMMLEDIDVLWED